MARPIIIDTDPGIDDAVAILLALASPEVDVLGLVAVAGNLPLALTARNARAILELAGRNELPVYAGCPRPIGIGRPDAEAAHGGGGLGDLVLSEPTTALRPQHGVMWLIETLRAAMPRSITLCALGPLTNIAAALVMAPDIAGGIAELVIMGGGSHGNITPAAEFNIHCDPQAAAIVFESGLPITLVPLDITEGVLATSAHVAAVAVCGTACAKAVATLIGPRTFQAGAVMAMHDSCVIAWLIAPELFEAREANVVVEIRSPLTAGMTVIDWRGRSGRPPNARVLCRADADGFFALLAERMANLP